MELFRNAKTIRLRSHQFKYMLADEDEESVALERNGKSRRARWTVEFVEGTNVLRFNSCYGKYLTATEIPFLLKVSGKKVLQTLPKKLDSLVEWEPIRESSHIKLKTRYGNFLRAHGGIPPIRNSITHGIPHRSSTQESVLWDVDVIERELNPRNLQPKYSGSSYRPDGFSHPISSEELPTLAEIEASDSHAIAPKADRRTIYFTIANGEGNVNDTAEESFTFKGTCVDELAEKLEEVTGLDDITVCCHNPLNGNLYPLRLQLPPNNTDMHVVVVQQSSVVET